jgi:basic membrane lipoprotein Med (substrate-binding protein (PBP1-ABC) superfamily)
VDSNQNYLHPGNMLTSMTKRVDVAIYDAFAAAQLASSTSDRCISNMGSLLNKKAAPLPGAALKSQRLE